MSGLGLAEGALLHVELRVRVVRALIHMSLVISWLVQNLLRLLPIVLRTELILFPCMVDLLLQLTALRVQTSHVLVAGVSLAGGLLRLGRPVLELGQEGLRRGHVYGLSD